MLSRKGLFRPFSVMSTSESIARVNRHIEEAALFLLQLVDAVSEHPLEHPVGVDQRVLALDRVQDDDRLTLQSLVSVSGRRGDAFSNILG